MGVDKGRLRQVKSLPPATARAKAPVDPADLEFVYDPHGERMFGISPASYIRRITGTVELATIREVIGRFQLVYDTLSKMSQVPVV